MWCVAWVWVLGWQWSVVDDVDGGGTYPQLHVTLLALSVLVWQELEPKAEGWCLRPRSVASLPSSLLVLLS